MGVKYIDHRNPDILNLIEIEAYFNYLDFTVISSSQSWRYVTGFLENDNKEYFFKVSTNSALSERLKTEIEWEEIRDREDIKLSCDFPQIYKTGFYKDILLYIVFEKVNGVPLANSTKNDDKSMQIFISHIKDVVKIIHSIMSINSDSLLPKDRKMNMSIADFIVGSYKKYLNEMHNRIDVKSLEKIIEAGIQYTTVAPAHCDFVPEHLLIENNTKLYVVDNEAFSLHHVKFYDLAYMYHRLYTKYCRPDIANKLLNLYESEYPLSKQEILAFRAILGARLIGGFLDAENDKGFSGGTKIKMQLSMRENLERGKII